VLTLRISEEEQAQLRERAEVNHQTVSEFVRGVVQDRITPRPRSTTGQPGLGHAPGNILDFRPDYGSDDERSVGHGIPDASAQSADARCSGDVRFLMVEPSGLSSQIEEPKDGTTTDSFTSGDPARLPSRS
jgi:hypothetical protein